MCRSGSVWTQGFSHGFHLVVTAQDPRHDSGYKLQCYDNLYNYAVRIGTICAVIGNSSSCITGSPRAAVVHGTFTDPFQQHIFVRRSHRLDSEGVASSPRRLRLTPVYSLLDAGLEGSYIWYYGFITIQ